MFVRTVFRSLISAIIAAAVCASPLPAQEQPNEMPDAVNAVRPALIRIRVVSAYFQQGRETKEQSSGSGAFITPDGYAITNHHVTAEAKRLFVTLADKREVEAKLVGSDPLADIAVVKVANPDGGQFAYAKFGDSSKLKVGDAVFAMGCPLAISQSVTRGIISNTEMIMPKYMGDDDLKLDGEEVGSIVRWIGHDATIMPGNSGGPLVDRNGLIVGVNEISFGLAGAIPGNLADEVAQKLIKDGVVHRSWLGIALQPLLESSGQAKGVLVSDALKDSPTDKAGIKSGDIVVSINNTAFTVKFDEEIPALNQFIADLPIGKPAQIKIIRNGAEREVAVTTIERPKAIDKEHELKGWGITATNITYIMMKERGLKTQDGVLVTGVLPSGPSGSAKPEIQEDDIIVRVGDAHIANFEQLRDVTKKLTAGREDAVPVVVQFNRKTKRYATVVKVGKADESEPGSEIRKAWIAVDTQVLTSDLAEALGAQGKTGMRIVQVYPGSEAEKAGLKVGDLIIRLDGEEIPAEQIGDEDVFPNMVRQYDIGKSVDLQILRDAKPLKVAVKLEASPKPVRDYPKHTDDNFEFTVRDITLQDIMSGDVENGQSGVYVASVEDGSWASVGGMKMGDTITAVDSAKIANLESLKAKLAEVAKAKPKSVVFTVRRGAGNIYLEIKPNWNGD